VNDEQSMDILMEELKANLRNNGVGMTEANMATPRNSGMLRLSPLLHMFHLSR